jgi:hypothetical protein
MTSILTGAALQAADTVVMVQARDGLGTAAAIADVALATVFALILLALVLLLFQLRGIHGTVRELSGRLEKRVDPVIERGKEVAANVEFITGALRTDVQRVSDSVKSLSERLQSASDRMERRVEEFNALMEVVQSEAEDIFIGSAAAMRGVRAGARALRDGRDAGDGGALDEDTGPHAMRGEALLGETATPSRALETAAETPLAPRGASGSVQVPGDDAVRRSGGA